MEITRNNIRIFSEVFSPVEVNTYIVTGDGRSCIIIDCGCYYPEEEKRLEERLDTLGIKPVMLLDTHCHLDHVFGNGFMLRRYGLRARFHPYEHSNLKHAPEHALMFGLSMDAPPGPGPELTEDEIIDAAGVTLEVIYVPGHSAGGVALLCREANVIFTGDALFAGSVGRSDLPGGDHELLVSGITKKIFTLPPETTVLPGHGPQTTIDREMKYNPYFN